MNYSALKALIELGIAQEHINTVDSFGMTPLHLACISFSKEVFDLLLTLNPNRKIADLEGNTPAFYLKESEPIDFDKLNKLINEI